ncbi:3-deoxy-manno-octulosonate cytidylyltransferase [Candidatus Profftia sp. (ex Adelges kitamiensis)]|uniref:3-deoxy-manno-octulosonate cytidylyltransferase n=1 Tax=Candidatus Profftia sp. (ex Adelges kitamiensis) TaxID=2864218 RepID=UPI001CE39017|nr:3-deoxy-manno-octulosonate cytidylyltransferase [Candidatus Profftia sp. (ex Adelges kitamiensis)]
MNFITIIPARNNSKRLPSKPLAEINGKPMVIHVIERALQSGATRVIVATDHLKIKQVVEKAGKEVCMTQMNHNSGTERIAEVIEKYRFADHEIILNIQGDELLFFPEMIHKVVDNIADYKSDMATLAVPITSSKEAFNPNTVKVVCDKNNYALYFSRATIPWDRDRFLVSRNKIGNNLLRHIGIYAYRAGFIRRYITWNKTIIEQIEMLEQLRVLWYGGRIHIDITKNIPNCSINTIEDLEQVRHIFAANKIK